MRDCSRIEIIIERAFAERLCDALDDAGAAGYTVIPRASGRGDRGIRRGDDPSGTLTNCVILVISEGEDQTEALVNAVRPLIKRFGGVCVVSAARWI